MKHSVTMVQGLVLFLFALMHLHLAAQQWKPAGNKLLTEWGRNLDPMKAWQEYPRPQMVRKDWTCLNGLWEYSIMPVQPGENAPLTFEGKILVPFAVESALSGVGRRVGKDSVLWYKRSFSSANIKRGQRLLLNFGAVDWRAHVFINGKLAGMHEGGYDPFFIDITEYLVSGGTQELLVKVWDPSDDGPQPRGKQVGNPRGIWYTPVTGIWQTVWLEAVPEAYIVNTKHTADIDRQTLTVEVEVANGNPASDQYSVSLWREGKMVASQTVKPGNPAVLPVSDLQLWSPDHPFLYDLKIGLQRDNKLLDEVASYCAMRKISVAMDPDGHKRMMLNNQYLFQYGPLDQGWWPDGLYTAPSDEALLFDIQKTREMGFNMIRKHVKTEPARWYYHCDKLGMLVWQDMPSGDLGNRWDSRPGIIGKAADKDRTPASVAMYKKEWEAIMKSLYNFPSIVVWVPFNEAWGQFNTGVITQWTMSLDPSRLVNAASGGNFSKAGHILDLHNYPEPVMPDPDVFGNEQVIVLGEFGGLGLPIEDHTWQSKNNWGYQTFKSPEELVARYAEFMDAIPSLIKKGLSAAVYTQTTDVEIETNGLMTYDRKIIKMPVNTLKALHRPLYIKNVP